MIDGKNEWVNKCKKARVEYFNLAYNAHAMLEKYYTFDEITQMPLMNLFAEIELFKPKLKEIARRQEQARLQAELEGKRKQKLQAAQQRRSMRG